MKGLPIPVGSRARVLPSPSWHLVYQEHQGLCGSPLPGVLQQLTLQSFPLPPEVLSLEVSGWHLWRMAMCSHAWPASRPPAGEPSSSIHSPLQPPRLKASVLLLQVWGRRSHEQVRSEVPVHPTMTLKALLRSFLLGSTSASRHGLPRLPAVLLQGGTATWHLSAQIRFPGVGLTLLRGVRSALASDLGRHLTSSGGWSCSTSACLPPPPPANQNQDETG